MKEKTQNSTDGMISFIQHSGKGKTIEMVVISVVVRISGRERRLTTNGKGNFLG